MFSDRRRRWLRLSLGFVLLVLIGVVVLIPGCSSTSLIRSSLKPCTNVDPDAGCPTSAIQYIATSGSTEPRYSLGFIEVDDQGQLKQRQQMMAVLNDIEATAREEGHDYISVVFVHGCKHGASPNDGNIETFRAALERLAQSELDLAKIINRPARRVAGVYIAWRGESLNVNYLDNLTFWDRKNTAHKVGHGAVTEILNRLDAIRIAKDYRDPSGRSRSRLIVIGHSFGGAIVYSAIGQLLQAKFLEPPPCPSADSDVEGFGNLVILINPAFEASLFSSLSDLSLERDKYANTQLPVLAILTSEADDATKIAFPLGRRISTLLEKKRSTQRFNAISGETENVDEHDTAVTAVGHYATYQTHTLKPADNVVEKGTSAERPATNVLGVAKQWASDLPGSTIQFPGTVLTRSKNSAGRNPFLVVKVDKALIRDHNDLSNPLVSEFIGHLILVSSQKAETRERRDQCHS